MNTGIKNSKSSIASCIKRFNCIERLINRDASKYAACMTIEMETERLHDASISFCARLGRRINEGLRHLECH